MRQIVIVVMKGHGRTVIDAAQATARSLLKRAAAAKPAGLNLPCTWFVVPPTA
jgi:hypothetical protein